MKRSSLEMIQRMQFLCKAIEDAQYKIEEGERAKMEQLRYEEELADLSMGFLEGDF